MDKNDLKIGDIIWVKLKGEDHIQHGVRPAVIIQNNKGNFHSPTIQIVPLTSKKQYSKLPTHVRIPANVGGLRQNSIAQCEGARPISKINILGFIGHLPDEYMARISIATLINTPIIKFLSQVEIQQVYDNSCKQ